MVGGVFFLFFCLPWFCGGWVALVFFFWLGVLWWRGRGGRGVVLVGLALPAGGPARAPAPPSPPPPP
ncbi:hypothetical protein, partial [Streptomyces sp. BE20]|uniref:hypothetical protein n=1 Tax=Streptomyces sp. BE20 TaxID=3002525 RepID=UPI002E7A7F3C